MFNHALLPIYPLNKDCAVSPRFWGRGEGYRIATLEKKQSDRQKRKSVTICQCDTDCESTQGLGGHSISGGELGVKRRKGVTMRTEGRQSSQITKILEGHAKKFGFL